MLLFPHGSVKKFPSRSATRQGGFARLPPNRAFLEYSRALKGKEELVSPNCQAKLKRLLSLRTIEKWCAPFCMRGCGRS